MGDQVGVDGHHQLGALLGDRQQTWLLGLERWTPSQWHSCSCSPIGRDSEKWQGTFASDCCPKLGLAKRTVGLHVPALSRRAPQHPTPRLAKINPVPKRICTSRAEWRLQTGKPAEALSANYRLECDFGTPVILCWEKGGNEPIYVCESHAKELGPSRDHGQEARVINTEAEQPKLEQPKPEQNGNPIQAKVRKRTHGVVVTKANGSASREARVISPEAEQNDNPIQGEVRSPTLEVAVAKPGVPASPEAPRKLEAPKTERKVAEASTKPRIRDLTFGNSAKAMVDEAIWNLAKGDYEIYRTALQQGKTPSEAAQAAGGQLAVIHQKIRDYALKLEAVLAESKTTINVAETIDKPLEQAVLETIGNSAMSDSEKDAGIQQLGAVQEWVKQGLQADMTPLQANQIMLAIGERLNWGGSSEALEECKPVYRTVYVNLKTAILAAVPDAKRLVDRLSNLYAAKSEVNPELLSTKELTSSSR